MGRMEYEDNIMAKALEHITNKSKKKEEISLQDDTVYYISEILFIMGNQNAPVELYKIMSPKTKDAFNEIGASEYGVLFNTTYNNINNECDALKGLFKSFRNLRIINKHIRELYTAVEDLDDKQPFVTNYLVPYIQKHYGEILNLE